MLLLAANHSVLLLLIAICNLSTGFKSNINIKCIKTTYGNFLSSTLLRQSTSTTTSTTATTSTATTTTAAAVEQNEIDSFFSSSKPLNLSLYEPVEIIRELGGYERLLSRQSPGSDAVRNSMNISYVYTSTDNFNWRYYTSYRNSLDEV